MKKFLMRGGFLSGYCIPFVFLAMYGDVTYDTMLLYALMIAGFWVLYVCTLKTKQWTVLIVGNLLSFMISYGCVQQFYTDTWIWYFKPFTANGLLIAISVVGFLVQLFFVYGSDRKQRIK